MSARTDPPTVANVLESDDGVKSYYGDGDDVSTRYDSGTDAYIVEDEGATATVASMMADGSQDVQLPGSLGVGVTAGTTPSGTVQVAGNLDINENNSLRDDGGTKRLSVSSNDTTLRGENGNVRFRAASGETKVNAGTTYDFVIDDKNQSKVGVKYVGGGTLRFPNSTIDMKGNAIDNTGNIDVNEGNALRDGSGTNRVEVLSDRTNIVNSAGNRGAAFVDGSAHLLDAYSTTPIKFIDNEQSATGVQYDTSANAGEGVLRTPNGGIFVENDPNLSPSNSNREGFQIRYQPAKDRTILESRDYDTGNNKDILFTGSLYNFTGGAGADLRIAEGQSIEDGSGTERMSISSGRTRLYDDTGTSAIDLQDGKHNAIKAYSNTPIRFVDQEGDFDAVQYDTDSSAGVLRTPNAGLAAQANGEPSSGKGVEVRYGSLGYVTSYDRDNNNYELLAVEGNDLRLNGRGGLVDMSQVAADLRLAEGQAIEDGSGTNRYEVNANNTIINNDAGNPALLAKDSARVRLFAESNEPVQIYDGEQPAVGVQYDTDASSGVLRTPNAGITVEDDGGNRSNALSLSYDTGSNFGQIVAEDASTTTKLFLTGDPVHLNSGDLRIATGQSIEDGGGTPRVDFDSNFTTINDEAGNFMVSANSGSGVFVKAYAGEDIIFKDGDGGFNALKYTTSSGTPGTLELTNALLSLKAGSGGKVIEVRPSVTGNLGSSATPAIQLGGGGAGFYLDSGNIKAVDESGNTATVV